MALTRQFLVSPALARLIRKERGVQGRVQEGYFASTPERTHFVRLDPPHSSLMMVAPGPDGEPLEEATEVPLSQAQALLDVAPGQIAYDRTALTLSPGVESVLEQILLSPEFNLLTVAFVDLAEADRFRSPFWVGPEVTGDLSFNKGLIALEAEPQTGEVEITNASLDALLDLLQSRSASRQARALSGWDQLAYRAPQPSQIDEQLLRGLTQALGSADQVESLARSGHLQADQGL
jgi:CYTH domain-containing protein